MSIKKQANLKLRFFYFKDKKNEFIESGIDFSVTKGYLESSHNTSRLIDAQLRSFQKKHILSLRELRVLC